MLAFVQEIEAEMEGLGKDQEEIVVYRVIRIRPS